jgi:hypothetical protein
MVVSTLFTLFIVPAVYRWLSWKPQRSATRGINLPEPSSDYLPPVVPAGMSEIR